MGEEGPEKLDLSDRNLKIVSKATEAEAKWLVELTLDSNALQKLDSIDSYCRLERLSIAKNNLLRMHAVGKLLCLRELNLSNNSILTIEGLKELVYLNKLILSGNNIKSIEHLNNNINLEHLDLSDNQISHISDISYLKNLKHLNLERNRIGNLKQCERYLPTSLVTFTISNNFLADLNTLCHLSHLENLENLSVAGNPCVSPKGNEKLNFDYRPFAINWAMNIKILDGYEVNAIESLKAEWLYSQGRGRQFREGEHSELVQYLSTTCPSGDAAPETEEQRKLRLILSKAQHHQQQLREQGSSSPKPRQSPRMHPRITGRIVKSPDRMMSTSYHSALSNKPHLVNPMSASFSGEMPLNSAPVKSYKGEAFSSLMSQSFDASSGNLLELNSEDSNILASAKKNNNLDGKNDTNKAIVNGIDSKKSSAKEDNKAYNQPLEAASKMVPVPDSMMSPDYQGPMFAPQNPPIAITPNKKNAIAYHPTSTPLSSSSTKTPTSHHASIQSISSSHCESPLSAKSGRTPSKPSNITKPGAHLNKSKGSPQMPRSAMSSPKMRHTVEKRKGSFSSKTMQKPDEGHAPSEKNSMHHQVAVNNRLNSSAKALPTTPGKNVNTSNVVDGHSSDDDSEMCVEKLKSIRDAANQRRKKQSISDSGSSENVSSNLHKVSACKTKQAYNAAVTIQKLWRGYRTRNLNQKTGNVVQSIQTMRARQYIEKLTCDMQATKAALDSERKIQQLQMQAINALWKKISAMECGGNTKECKTKSATIAERNENLDELDGKDSAVRELTQTCCMLQAQVQQLQGSMKDILQLVAHKYSAAAREQWPGGVATQTEISAVHTPQGDGATWPYQKAILRPSSLSLSIQNNFNRSTSNGTEAKEPIVEGEDEEHVPGMADKSAKVPCELSDVDNQTSGSKDASVGSNNVECKLSEELAKDCLGKNMKEGNSKPPEVSA